MVCCDIHVTGTAEATVGGGLVWPVDDERGTATSTVVSTAAKAGTGLHAACTASCTTALGPVWTHLLCAAGCGSQCKRHTLAAERAGVMPCARSCALPLPAALQRSRPRCDAWGCTAVQQSPSPFPMLTDPLPMLTENTGWKLTDGQRTYERTWVCVLSCPCRCSAPRTTMRCCMPVASCSTRWRQPNHRWVSAVPVQQPACALLGRESPGAVITGLGLCRRRFLWA